MRRFYSAPIVLLFLILARCSSTQADVAQASRSELQNYRQIAVLQLEFQVSGTDALSLTENFWDILQATNQGVQRPSFQTRQAEKVQRTQGRLHELESDMINIMNRHLLSRGFNPLDRSAVVLLLKEHSLMNTGLYDNSKSLQIGRLATADAVLVGSLRVNVQGADMPSYEIVFYGKMLAVESGKILALGESHTTTTEFTRDAIRSVINAWFDELDELN